jgi:hypothetical protein
MVTVKPGGSSPAALTQRQVDAFASGQPGDAAALLRASRNEMTAGRSRTKGSDPVALAPKEMQGIARTGVAPNAVLKRIATAEAPAKQKKSKAAPVRRYAGRAPKLTPPNAK